MIVVVVDCEDDDDIDDDVDYNDDVDDDDEMITYPYKDISAELRHIIFIR